VRAQAAQHTGTGGKARADEPQKVRGARAALAPTENASKGAVERITGIDQADENREVKRDARSAQCEPGAQTRNERERAGACGSGLSGQGRLSSRTELAPPLLCASSRWRRRSAATTPRGICRL
jgi:hypothetical protein